MKKLKKALRLNAELRHEIAINVAKDRLEFDPELEAQVQEAAKAVLHAACEAYGVADPEPGALPVTTVLRFETEDNQIDLSFLEPVPVPFAVYVNPKLVAQNPEWGLDALVEASEKMAEYNQQARAIETNVVDFLTHFPSPAKLLEKAPDFEQFLPDHCFDDEDSSAFSLEDVLNGDAAIGDDAA
jgi:hypothetical protein